jgi:hypothetical protein
MSFNDYLAGFILLVGPMTAIAAALTLTWKRQSNRKAKNDTN